jgi:hypothetical protein
MSLQGNHRRLTTSSAGSNSSKKQWVFIRESQWKTCNYGSLDFTVLVFSSGGYMKTTVYATRNKRSVTPEGQILCSYWNSRARDAISCVGGIWIHTRHLYRDRCYPYWHHIAHVKFWCFSGKIKHILFFFS